MQQGYSIVSININPTMSMQKRCIRYDLPRVIKDTSVEIIDQVHTHSLHGFSGYIKLKFVVISAKLHNNKLLYLF